MFGVGPYSFTDARAGISGLHEEPRFEAFYEGHGGQPAVFDDTCQVLARGTALQATACAHTLSHVLVRRVLQSITLKDAKRPITKKVLERVNFLNAAEQIDADDAREGVADILRGLGGDGALPEDFSLSDAVADRHLLLEERRPRTKRRVALSDLRPSRQAPSSGACPSGLTPPRQGAHPSADGRQ